MWARARATPEEIKVIAAEATGKGVTQPVMAQFFLSRGWLWRQWRSTIVAAVLPREVLYNLALTAFVVAFFNAPGPHLAWRSSLFTHLAGVNQVWMLASSLVTFTISFFLTQAYGVRPLARRAQATAAHARASARA